MESSANSQSALMRKVLLVLSFIFSAAFAVAQQPPAAYLKAKSDLDAKEYALAKDGFTPFLGEANYGFLSYYAAFYSAEAALQLQQAPQAIELLTSLKGKNWSKSEEVTYLLALAARSLMLVPSSQLMFLPLPCTAQITISFARCAHPLTFLVHSLLELEKLK